jgi:tetratricopeptide (TPR) repeat protein
MGRSEESLTEYRRAAALDPLSPVIASELSYVLAVTGHPDLARVQAERAVELDPGLGRLHANAGRTYLMVGDHARAIAALERADRIDAQTLWPLALLVVAHARAGQPEPAKRRHQELTERSSKLAAPQPLAVAIAELGLGRHEQALAALADMVRVREGTVGAFSLPAEPLFDPLRKDPRFAALLVRMHLPASRPSGVRGR